MGKFPNGVPEFFADRRMRSDDRSGAKFRRFKRQTFHQYRVSAASYCALVVRYLLWSSFKTSRQRLGKFRPILTQDLQRLFKELYVGLQKGEDAVVADLAPIFHQIIIHTTRQTLSTGRLVDSAAEQSILIALLMPGKDEWKTALSTTQMFARWQRLIFSASAHDGDREGGDYKLADDGAEAENDKNDGGADQSDDEEAADEDEFPDQLGDNFEVEADEANDAIDLTPFEEEEELEPLGFALPALYAPSLAVDDDSPDPTPMVDMRLRCVDRTTLPTAPIDDIPRSRSLQDAAAESEVHHAKARGLFHPDEPHHRILD